MLSCLVCAALVLFFFLFFWQKGYTGLIFSFILYRKAALPQVCYLLEDSLSRFFLASFLVS
jgi:hypothetical protein